MGAADLMPAQRADLGKRFKQISDEIDMLEARWLELSTRLDALSAQPAD
jgi:ATP-binding cassette subfamily F protein 3